MITTQPFDNFVDHYVRPDEGTAILLCAHADHVQPAAQIYASLVTRGHTPCVVTFANDDETTNNAVSGAFIAQHDTHVRRVVLIVCDAKGSMLRPALDVLPEGTPLFRVSGHTARKFDN